MPVRRRDFSVVADKVRLLTERTRLSTGKIARMIDAISGEIQNTVDRVEVANGAMQTGVSHLHAAVEQTEYVRQHPH